MLDWGSPTPKAGDVVTLGQVGGPSLELEVTEVSPGGAVAGHVLRVLNEVGDLVGTIDTNAAPPFEDEGGPTDA